MILHLIALLCSFLILARELKSFIFVSEYTPSDLLSDFSFLSNTSSVLPILRFSDSLLPAIQKSQPHCIFDFTYSLLYRASLRQFAVENRVLFFSSRDSTNYSEWVFSLHPRPSTEAQAIRSFLKYMNWTDYHLLTSESARSTAMFSLLSSTNYEILSNSADQEVFDLYSSRIIKASGNWKVVLLGEEKAASKLLLGLEKSRIWKERCGFVVSSKGWNGSKKLGAIGILEEGLEDAQSEGEYHAKSVLRTLKILDDLTEDLKGPVVSNEILAKRLREKSPNNIVSETFSILNFKQDSRVIGKIEKEKVEIWEEIVFPGNITYMNNSPPIVLVSANTGVLSEDPNIVNQAFLFNLGLQPMVQLVNRDPSILTNFHLELHETDCGYGVFEYEYASKCMKKHFDKIGIAHLASWFPDVLVSYLDLFKEHKIQVPHITTGYTEPKLYDKNSYPEVLVTIPDSTIFSIIFPYILNSFGFRNIILLSDKLLDDAYLSVLIESAKILNINILNTAETRYIPYEKTENYFEEVKPIIQFIHDSKCRIIVFTTSNSYHAFFIEALYDFGYRRGELVFGYPNSLTEFLAQSDAYNVDREKVSEVASGSLSIVFDQYVGEYGQKLYEQIASIVYPYPSIYSCYQIDALMLAVRSIDLMINSGADYENFEDLMRFIRGIRFTGCTGKVSIDSGGNGLSDIVYTIYNFYKLDGKEYDEIAGSYIFGVTVPLIISKSIVWPDGTTQIPKDMIEETKCGFPDILVKTNQTSREISGAVTSGLFIAVFIGTVLVWRQFKEFKIDYLAEKNK